jgi:hypothetical protein
VSGQVCLAVRPATEARLPLAAGFLTPLSPERPIHPEHCGPDAAALATQLDDAGLPRIAAALRARVATSANHEPPHDALLKLALLLEQLREGLALQALVGQGA